MSKREVGADACVHFFFLQLVLIIVMPTACSSAACARRKGGTEIDRFAWTAGGPRASPAAVRVVRACGSVADGCNSVQMAQAQAQTLQVAKKIGKPAVCPQKV